MKKQQKVEICPQPSMDTCRPTTVPTMKMDKRADENGKQTIEKQPHWALERTRLAKERTFAAWLRTYYIVLKKLEKEGFEGLPAKAMGTLAFCFLLIAILAFVIILMH